MKRGPSLLARLIISRMSVAAPPRSIGQWGTDVSLDLGWFSTATDAVEAIEKWAPQVLSRLRHELDELNRLGRFAPYAFNSSSSYLVQGSAFIEPCDSDELKGAKTKRAHFSSYLTALKELTPREFEMLCTGVIKLVGVEDPVLTPYSADEGLDFYGRLRLEKNVLRGTAFPGLQTQLSVWMVGQAKHYTVGKVSTPDIRELVGAVTLAKVRAFGSGTMKYADLIVRVCDPVFYLFFTTGRLSSDAWALLDRSGVVGMDGEMLAAFLADQGIGLNEDKFEKVVLMSWLAHFDTDRSAA